MVRLLEPTPDRGDSKTRDLFKQDAEEQQEDPS